MKEHPILFSGEMIQAILEGRKTQTRRVVKGKSLDAIEFLSGRCDGEPGETEDLYQMSGDDGIKIACAEYLDEGFLVIQCPFGKPGDRLWVKETWWCDNIPGAFDTIGCNETPIYYRATEEDPSIFPKWKPSIFMYREFSRILLEVINIRVERLNDITEDDACHDGGFIYSTQFVEKNYGINRFKNLWNSINGKRGYGWDVNPWVWVIGFKVLEPNSRDKQ